MESVTAQATGTGAGALGAAGGGANGLPVDGSNAPLIDLTDDQAGLPQSAISFRDDAGSGTDHGLTSMESDGLSSPPGTN